MTNDGLLGYSHAGGAETYKVVPDLATGLPTVSDGGLTYTFQLRKGIRYSTGGVVQPADIRRGIERALLRERRPVSECPLPGRDRGQPRLPDGQAQALRSHARHHDQPGIEHGDLPPQQARSRLPVQARTARVRRRSGLDAASRAAAAARDRPVQDRRLPDEGRRRARPQPALPRLVGRGAAGRLPRQDRRTVPVHGSVRDPRGRARHRRHHGGRLRSDLAACARGLPPDALLEPALPRAAAHDPRALAEHEARAVQRRPRPAGVQPRGRPRPARPDQRWRGGVPVPAAERERLQLLLPVQRAQPRARRAGSSPSPAPRGSRSRSGSTTSRPGTGTPRTWSRSCKASATRLGSSTFRIPRGTSPGAATARRASKAGAATTPPPATSSSRSSAAPIRPTRRNRTGTSPGSATGIWMRRSLVHGRSRRPTPPRRPAPGTAPTAC